MKRATKTAKTSAKVQSLDGILTTNRSYQPSGVSNKRPPLGEIADKLDGFYPQRLTSELGKTASEGSIFMDDDPAIEASQVVEHETPMKDKTPNKPNLWRRFRQHRKSKDKKPLTRKQKIIKRGILALLVIAIAVGGYFGFKFWQTSHNVFYGGGQSVGLTGCKDINQLKKEGDCRINILLLGIGGPGHSGPNLTDTIMLASIDPINNSIALVSIPRDLWVQIPGYGSQKINAAYAYGKEYSKAKSQSRQYLDGFKLIDQALAPAVGVNIDYHVLVNFAAFKEAVNDVGGVTINAPEALYDPTIAWENKNNPLIAQKGVQTMNGAQALLYARSRETSSDFARGQRQRALLVAIGNKVLSLGTFSNPVRVSNLLSSFGNNVFTDFSLGNLKPMYKLISKVPTNDITSLDIASSPGNLVTTGNLNGLSVVYPIAGIFNYSQTVPYVRSTLRDGFIAKENAQIAIYNATGVGGLATKKSSVLQSYGYRIIDAQTAPHATNPSKTILVDLSGGKNKYTRHYLELRFGVSASTSLPSEFGIKPSPNADFVIILGQDATTLSATTTTN